jgi:hypothetical protein
MNHRFVQPALERGRNMHQALCSVPRRVEPSDASINLPITNPPRTASTCAAPATEPSSTLSVEYSYAIVIDNSLPSYPGYGDPSSSFVDG